MIIYNNVSKFCYKCTENYPGCQLRCCKYDNNSKYEARKSLICIIQCYHDHGISESGLANPASCITIGGLHAYAIIFFS